MATLWGTSANLRDFFVLGYAFVLIGLGRCAVRVLGKDEGRCQSQLDTNPNIWQPLGSWPQLPFLQSHSPGVRETPGSTAMARAAKGWEGGTASISWSSCVPVKWEQGPADGAVSSTCCETPGTEESQESPGCWWDKSQVSASDHWFWKSSLKCTAKGPVALVLMSRYNCCSPL